MFFIGFLVGCLFSLCFTILNAFIYTKVVKNKDNNEIELEYIDA